MYTPNNPMFATIQKPKTDCVNACASNWWDQQTACTKYARFFHLYQNLVLLGEKHERTVCGDTQTYSNHCNQNTNIPNPHAIKDEHGRLFGGKLRILTHPCSPNTLNVKNKDRKTRTQNTHISCHETKTKNKFANHCVRWVECTKSELFSTRELDIHTTILWCSTKNKKQKWDYGDRDYFYNSPIIWRIILWVVGAWYALRVKFANTVAMFNKNQNENVGGIYGCVRCMGCVGYVGIHKCLYVELVKYKTKKTVSSSLIIYRTILLYFPIRTKNWKVYGSIHGVQNSCTPPNAHCLNKLGTWTGVYAHGGFVQVIVYDGVCELYSMVLIFTSCQSLGYLNILHAFCNKNKKHDALLVFYDSPIIW